MMKDSQYSKRNSKDVKLPQISSKTSPSLSSMASNTSSRVQPIYSDAVNQLQKNLFSQLDQYEDRPKKFNKKAKPRKDESLREQINQFNSDAPYLKKLEKLLPDTYNKLVSATQPEPSKEYKKIKQQPKLSNSLIHNSSQIKSNKNTSIDMYKQKQSSSKLERKVEDSFTVAERQVDAIYQRYLEQEGLTDLNNTHNSKDLEQLNDEINSTDKDLQELRKSFYGLINRFSSQCLHGN